MRLGALVAGFRVRWLCVALASFAAAANEALFIVLVTSLAGSLLGMGQFQSNLLGVSLAGAQAVGVAGILLIVKFGLSALSVSLAARLAEKLTFSTRSRVLDAYLNASWPTQQHEPKGRLQELLTTFVDRVNTAMTGLTMAITATCSVVAFLTAAAMVEPIATLISLGALSSLAILLLPLRQRLRLRAARLAESGVEFAKVVAEAVSLSLETHVFGVKTRFSERLNEYSASNATAKRRVQVLTSLLPQAYISLAYLAVLGGLGAIAIVGIGGLAGLGAIMLLLLRTLSYAQQLMSGLSIVSGALPFLKQLDTFMNRYLTSPALAGKRIPAGDLAIALDAVSFRYERNPYVLKDVTVRIAAGERVGIVGPSGAGKSTFAQLVMGVQSPHNGTVLFGDVPVGDIAPDWLSSERGFVPQEPVLLNASVRDNIAFLRDVSDDAVTDALAKANILGVIKQLPEQLCTIIGPSGVGLSGGQKQRISIARALVGNPRLVVLDEPTSALDGESEAAVQDALAALPRDTTILIIAHRMSTLGFCDRILRIDRGQIQDVTDRSDGFERESGLVETSEAVKE